MPAQAAHKVGLPVSRPEGAGHVAGPRPFVVRAKPFRADGACGEGQVGMPAEQARYPCRGPHLYGSPARRPGAAQLLRKLRLEAPLVRVRTAPCGEHYHKRAAVPQAAAYGLPERVVPEQHSAHVCRTDGCARLDPVQRSALPYEAAGAFTGGIRNLKVDAGIVGGDSAAVVYPVRADSSAVRLCVDHAPDKGLRVLGRECRQRFYGHLKRAFQHARRFDGAYKPTWAGGLRRGRASRAIARRIVLQRGGSGRRAALGGGVARRLAQCTGRPRAAGGPLSARPAGGGHMHAAAARRRRCTGSRCGQPPTDIV